MSTTARLPEPPPAVVAAWLGESLPVLPGLCERLEALVPSQLARALELLGELGGPVTERLRKLRLLAGKVAYTVQVVRRFSPEAPTWGIVARLLEQIRGYMVRAVLRVALVLAIVLPSVPRRAPRLRWRPAASRPSAWLRVRLLSCPPIGPPAARQATGACS